MAPYTKPLWKEEGPGPLSLPNQGYAISAGAIEAVAVDPFNRDRVFVATVGGGIWLSNDAVSSKNPTWTPQSDFAPGLSMAAIAFDPNDPQGNTLWAGCAMTSHAVPLVGSNVGPLLGLLRTTDGTHWSEVARSVFQGQDVWRVVPTLVQTNTGYVVLVAASNGLVRSIDSGANWATSGPLTAPVTDIAMEPGTQTAYVAGGGRLWKSVDAGDMSWQDVTPAVWGTLPVWSTIRIAISPGQDAQGRHWIYASSTGGSNAANNVVFSNDGGTSWHTMGPAPDQSNASAPFVVSPLRPDVVFCISDAGSPNHYMVVVDPTQAGTWTSIELAGANNTGPHTDTRDMAITADGSILFDCNDGGIYRLANPHGWNGIVRQWDEAVGNIRIAEFNSIAYDSTFKIVFGAAQDNSIPQQTTPGDANWQFNEKDWGDGFQVGIDLTSAPNATTHYSSQQNLGFMVRRTYSGPTSPSPDHWIGLQVNGTGGVEIHDFETNLKDDGGSYSIQWNNGFAVHATNGSRLLIGTTFLYESFDRGETLTALGGVAKTSKNNWAPQNPIGTVTAYAYGHRWNADALYVGGGGRLWARTSGSGMPSLVSTYTGSTPFDIAFDPDDPKRVFVLDAAGRIWRTTDGGATANNWHELTGNLGSLAPDGALATLSLRTLAVPSRSFFQSEVVFVAGYGGVYVTQDPKDGRFAFWRKHGLNLPNAIVTDLHYSAIDDVLIAGTLGRAAWSLHGAIATVVGQPRVSITTSPHPVSCFGGWVEGTDVTMKAEVLSGGNLTSPLSYRWTVQGGTTASLLTSPKIVVTMPLAGTEVVVTLTVTDVAGFTMFAAFDDWTVSAQAAGLRSRLCQLIARIRSEEIWHWPINPLGPDPGPEGLAFRPDYAALRGLGQEIARVAAELQNIDATPITAVGGARRVLTSTTNRPANRPALLRRKTDTERLTPGLRGTGSSSRS